MSLKWEQIIVYSIAPVDLGTGWCTALSFIVVNDDPEEFPEDNDFCVLSSG